MDADNWISVDTKSAETWASAVKRAMYQRFREMCASLVIKGTIVDWLNGKIRPKIQERNYRKWFKSESDRILAQPERKPVTYYWPDDESEWSDDEYQEFDDNVMIINMLEDRFTRDEPTRHELRSYEVLTNRQAALMRKGVYGYESEDDSDY